MKAIVPTTGVEYIHAFPRYRYGDVPDEELRQYLYSPDDPNLCDDDHVLVMDYDGFIEWFPEWNRMYADQIAEEFGDDWYKDDEGAEYLREHVDRTVSTVKMLEVIE